MWMLFLWSQFILFYSWNDHTDLYLTLSSYPCNYYICQYLELISVCPYAKHTKYCFMHGVYLLFYMWSYHIACYDMFYTWIYHNLSIYWIFLLIYTRRYPIVLKLDLSKCLMHEAVILFFCNVIILLNTWSYRIMLNLILIMCDSKLFYTMILPYCFIHRVFRMFYTRNYHTVLYMEWTYWFI